ncbi:hypothetical protein J6590_023573, partial [Homalodisca vitripennis]
MNIFSPAFNGVKKLPPIAIETRTPTKGTGPSILGTIMLVSKLLARYFLRPLVIDYLPKILYHESTQHEAPG